MLIIAFYIERDAILIFTLILINYYNSKIKETSEKKYRTDIFNIYFF